MSEWKKVDEVKPEYNKEVLIFADDRDFYVASWHQSEMWYDPSDGRFLEYSRITHWVELPDFPMIEETHKTEEKPKMKSGGLFLDVWADSSSEDVFNEFSVGASDREGINILFAYYDCPPYEGYAFVLFEKNGQLYEVNASHCSCYGLENQWDPEKTSVKAMLFRCENGKIGYGYGNELKQILLTL